VHLFSWPWNNYSARVMCSTKVCNFYTGNIFSKLLSRWNSM
jgi:hypothetical protein